MLRLILALLLLLLLGQAGLAYLAVRQEARRAQLYEELRTYIYAADQYAGRALYWEGRWSQCNAY